MTSSILAALILLSLFASPSFAGSPPEKNTQTPDQAAQSCEALGTGGEILDGGCRNSETGAALICKNDQCTDYFADPRYKKIKSFLDTHRKPQTRAPQTTL